MERDRKSKGVASVPNRLRYLLLSICFFGALLPVLIQSLVLELGILDILTYLLWSCLPIVFIVNISLATENRLQEMTELTFPVMLASLFSWSSWFSLQSKPNDHLKNLQRMLLPYNIFLLCFFLWEEMMINFVRNDKISDLRSLILILLDGYTHVSNLVLYVFAFIALLDQVVEEPANSVVFKSSGWLTIVLYSMVPWLSIEWQFRHRVLRSLSAYFLAFTVVSIFEKSLTRLGGLYFLILYAMKNHNMFTQGLQRILDKIIITKSRLEEIPELEEAMLNSFQPDESQPEEELELREAIHNSFQPNEICVPPLHTSPSSTSHRNIFNNIREIASESDVISSEGKIAKEGNKLKISHEDDLLPPNRAPYEICVPPLDPQFRNSRTYRNSSDLHLIAKVGERIEISSENDLVPPNIAPDEVLSAPFIGKEMGVIRRRTPNDKEMELGSILKKFSTLHIARKRAIKENDFRKIASNVTKEMARYQRTQNERRDYIDAQSAPFIGNNLVRKDTLGSHGSKMVSEIAAELDVSSEGKIAIEGKKFDLSHEADSVSLNIASDEEDYLGDCILYFSQFPADYEFTKDTLVWSWIAAGAVQSDENDEMETIAIRCFDRLIMLEFILPSGHDRLCDQMIYKLGKDKNVLSSKKNQGHKYRKSLESDADLAEIEHLSLISEGINQLNLEILRKCINLKTLLLHKCCSSEIENLLNGIFLKLKLLTLIDLSCTNVVELPSSVENLTALEYLDMSQTPIRFLPESIGSLGNLETLKLLGCRSLFGLPRGICKLIKLQHFELDIQSMPIGMGNLTNLRTLRKFVVGRKDGNGIGELRNMNKLKGSLRIVKLENILNKEEAGKALLRDKQNLTKLELLWSDLEDDKVTIEEQILENLQPPSGLQELRIAFYSGGVLPSWISDPSFNQLVNITLSGCRYCELLPTFGQLPSLKILRVYGMDSVVAIEFSFCRKQNIDHQHAFPRLEKLSFDGMSNLEKWTGVEDGDFPCLVQLVIKDCPKLASLPFPSHWISRMNLEISNCKCLMESQIKN